MSPEELTALTEAEDFIANFKEEDLEDPDKASELAKRLKDAQTTVHQKRHYRDKAKTLETELTGLKNPKPEVKKPEKKEEEAPKEDPLVLIAFRQDHPELTKDVAKEIVDGARAYGVSPEEYMKRPMVQKYIKDNQTQEDVEDASVAPGNRSSSEIAKKDWSNASQAEIEAARNKILTGQ